MKMKDTSEPCSYTGLHYILKLTRKFKHIYKHDLDMIASQAMIGRKIRSEAY